MTPRNDEYPTTSDIRLKVALVGNLAGVAYNVQRGISKYCEGVDLFLSAWDVGVSDPRRDESPEVLPSNCSIYSYGLPDWRSRGLFSRLIRRMYVEIAYLPLLIKLLRYEVVQSFTATLFFSVSSLVVYGALRLKPYIACATGSDLREAAAMWPGWSGFVYRYFFRRASKVYLLNSDLFEVADRLNITNVAFLPFPLNVERFRPRSVGSRLCPESQLLIFMPSNLDWGNADNNPTRIGTKGNDRLIRAFARFIDRGHAGHLLLLDRGPDRTAARQLVETLSIQQHVTWLPEMNKDQLIQHYNMADIVADQFDIGSLGLTAIEAMSCGTPVLIYLKAETAQCAYSELPPIANVHTEDDILSALVKLTDKKLRSYIGQESREWVKRHHSQNTVARRLIADYQKLRGLNVG